MTSEQADLKLTVRLVKWAIGVGLVAAFTFGLWVARLQSQVDKIPLLEQAVEELRVSHRDIRDILRDMALLQCSDPQGMNATDRSVCARYQPRIP